MFGKMLLAGVFALMISAGAFAEDIVALSFNFYADGEITPDGELPAGVVMKKKVRFHNKKLFGFGHPFDISLDKIKSWEQTFKVKGEDKIVVSVSGRSVVDGKRAPAPMIECTELVVNGKAVKPFTFNKWRAAAGPIFVKDGDTITLKVSFEKTE